MSNSKRAFILLICSAGFLVWGQAPSAPSAPAAPAPSTSSAQISPSELAALVEKQFGGGFEVVTSPPLAKIGGKTNGRHAPKCELEPAAGRRFRRRRRGRCRDHRPQQECAHRGRCLQI